MPLLVSLLASKSEAVQVSFETRSPEPPSLSRVLVARTASRQVGCATLLGNIAMHEAYAARLAKDALAPLLQSERAAKCVRVFLPLSATRLHVLASPRRRVAPLKQQPQLMVAEPPLKIIQRPY